MLRFLLCSVLACCCTCARRPPAAAPPPAVILKLDDLRFEDGSVDVGWSNAFDYLNAKGVTATIGLIGSSLEDADEPYYAWIREQGGRGHEIWNHGYCHCRPRSAAGDTLREFSGTEYTYQLRQLRRTQELARQHLGFPLRSFGAPYNATDSLTARAMAEVPDLEVWMYKDGDAPTDKYLLPRTAGVNIEYPTHHPDFARFRAAYLAHRDAPVLVIQGHPKSWVEEPERLEEFKRIVDFLLAEGVQFTTPYAYYRSSDSR